MYELRRKTSISLGSDAYGQPSVLKPDKNPESHVLKALWDFPKIPKHDMFGT